MVNVTDDQQNKKLNKSLVVVKIVFTFIIQPYGGVWRLSKVSQKTETLFSDEIELED